MQFSSTLAAAALFLAVASPALAVPGCRSEADGPHCSCSRSPSLPHCGSVAKVGSVAVTEEEISIDYHYSKKVYSEQYDQCLKSEAHAMYKEALDIYYRVKKLMLHTLCKEGTVREERLLEIVFSIQRAENILEAALLVNKRDTESLRRQWVKHEIKSLLDRFAIARIKATHLPNLAFAEHAYKFVIDETKLVAGVAVEIAVAVPGLIVYGVKEIVAGAILTIKEAAKIVKHCLHEIKVKVGWAIDEIEEEFIYIGHKLHEIGHKIQVGIHEKWEHLKEKFHRHDCHDDESCTPCGADDDRCPVQTGEVVLVQEEEEVVSFSMTKKRAQFKTVQFVQECVDEEAELDDSCKEQQENVLAAFGVKAEAGIGAEVDVGHGGAKAGFHFGIGAGAEVKVGSE